MSSPLSVRVIAPPSTSYSQDRDPINHRQYTNPRVNVSPPHLRRSTDIYQSNESGPSMYQPPWSPVAAPSRTRLYIPTPLQHRLQSPSVSGTLTHNLDSTRQTRSFPAYEIFNNPSSPSTHSACAPRSSTLLHPVRQPHPPPIDPLLVNFGRFRAKSASPSSDSSTLITSSSRSITTGRTSTTTASKVYQPTFMLQSFEAGRSQVRNRNNSGGYQGDVNSKMYRSQISGLPDHLNTALWIFAIPVWVTESYLFDLITCGAVSALNLKGPDSNHDMAAADLIFKTPEGAARFLAEINDGIILDGRNMRGIYNTRGQERDLNPNSRVIRIEGPEDIMTYEYWFEYFGKVCIFSWERALEVSQDRGRKTLELRFVRIIAQAQACLEAIRSDPALRETVRVWYERDPCEGVAP